MIGDNRYENEAPFSIISDILKRISNLLDTISTIEIGMWPDGSPITDKGDTQHIKYNILYQLYMQSILLIKDDSFNETMGKKFEKIQLKSKKTFDKKGHFQGWMKIYDPDINKELNKIQIEIQTILRKEGYTSNE